MHWASSTTINQSAIESMLASLHPSRSFPYEVFLAADANFGRPYAVKTFLCQKMNDLRRSTITYPLITDTLTLKIRQRHRSAHTITSIVLQFHQRQDSGRPQVTAFINLPPPPLIP